MKKEEIMSTFLLWEKDATTHKELIMTYRKELTDLFNRY